MPDPIDPSQGIFDNLNSATTQWLSVLNSMTRSSLLFSQNLDSLAIAPLSNSFIELNSSTVLSQMALQNLTEAFVQLTEIMKSLFSNILKPVAEDGDPKSTDIVLKIHKDFLTGSAELAGIFSAGLVIVKKIAPHLLKNDRLLKAIAKSWTLVKLKGVGALGTLKNTGVATFGLLKTIGVGTLAILKKTGVATFGLLKTISVGTLGLLKTIGVATLGLLKTIGVATFGIMKAGITALISFITGAIIPILAIVGVFILVVGLIDWIIALWDSFKKKLDSTNPIIGGIIKSVDKLLNGIKWIKDTVLSLFQGDKELEFKSTIVKNEKRSSDSFQLYPSFVPPMSTQSYSLINESPILMSSKSVSTMKPVIPATNNCKETLQNTPLSSSITSKPQNISNNNQKHYNIAKLEINDGAITNLEDLISSLRTKLPNN